MKKPVKIADSATPQVTVVRRRIEKKSRKKAVLIAEKTAIDVARRNAAGAP